MGKPPQFREEDTKEVRRRTWPAWNPNDATSRLLTCQNTGCDNDYVDPEFARILGDGDTVYACPKCTSWAALKSGAAADPEFNHRVDETVSQQRASDWKR